MGCGASVKVRPQEFDLTVTTKSTEPIAGQKPGTSGLRKKTKVFMEGNYLANYVQSVFNSLVDEGVQIEGGTLVVSGDGRFFNIEAIQIIIKMAFGAGVGTVWCGKDGLLSTPAMSAVIRCRETGFKPFGGFICTASHNPGGIDNDFGIKYNCENGGPAPEKLTDQILEWTKNIWKVKSCDAIPDVDLGQTAIYKFGDRTVHVFDGVEDHMALLQSCFSFDDIRALIARADFTLTYDCLSGVAGPYATGIIEGALGAAVGTCKNAQPKPDFGGPDSPHHGHADPNLTYAVELAKEMGLNKDGQKIATEKPPPTFGAGADGDADRNMILGPHFFVSPSDSLAIIVANSDLIPQFKDGLKGCARSMPTSCALDIVAKAKGIPFWEVPVGWKFFGNLMDSGTEKYFPNKDTYTPFICGEEAFSTGADHSREKDGMWAVLAWLQIISKKTEIAGTLASVEAIVNAHWKTYGRNYYVVYTYEEVDKLKAEEMMQAMRDKVNTLAGQVFGGMKIVANDEFEYHDPVDGSISKKQGLRFFFEDRSRIVFRLSGTGVVGASVRLYLEKYEAADGSLNQHQFEVVKPLAEIAMKLSKLKEYVGRDMPSVIC